jgi:uncharacterized protein YeaO (DUF488 family)
MPVTFKRIYESPTANDGYRILIDRLWPRGIKKDSAKIDKWLKEIAPSHELRKWFDHDPAKWAVFQNRYLLELKKNIAWAELRNLAEQHKVVTLLFAAKDEKHNHAVILARLLNG